MIALEALEDKYKNKICFVLGSGESLLSTLKYIPRSEQVYLIAVNKRPLSLIACDMIVSIDHTQAEFNYKHIRHNLFKISPFKNYSDIILPEYMWWGRFSSFTATWLACYMGFDKVVLLGMDCYQGRKRHFDSDEPPDFKNQHGDGKLDSHLLSWKRAFEKCKNPERIRALNNPLERVFGRWL